MAAKDTNDERKRDDLDNEGVLDMSQAAVKKMIADAREKGYITYDQLNRVLPPDQVSSEQIEDVMNAKGAPIYRPGRTASAIAAMWRRPAPQQAP